MKKFVNLILSLALSLAAFSCNRLQPDSIPEGMIAFSQEGLVDFSATAQTKATEVTESTLNGSGFNVSCTTGSAGSESNVWNNVAFSKSGSYFVAGGGGKWWPDANPSYHFYASNAALTFNAGGCTVAATNATDVVCAYMPSPTYKSRNTLQFKHIFARITDVTFSAADGYTISGISVTVTPKTGGTYNLRTGSGQTDGTGWSSLTTGIATAIANSTPGTKSNNLYLVPGRYVLTASWTATKGDYTKTFSNKTYEINVVGGKCNIITASLVGDASAIEFAVSVTPWSSAPTIERVAADYMDILDYLTFYCDEAGTIGWKCDNASVARTIQYSKDFGATWTDLTSTTSGATVAVNAGDIVWFKGSNTEYATSWDNYNQFTLSNKAHVYGNVNSLTGNNTSVSEYCFFYLFADCSNLYTYEHKRIILPATTLGEDCYECMFSGCTSLTTAPELPATTLAECCYCCMFDGCTSLTTAPALPATTLASDCYNCMFLGCTSLTSAPELPATTLAESCYSGMFLGCTSLTTAPELPATTLANNCYEGMFTDCTSLNYIKALFTTDPSSGYYTPDWVSGVAPTGTFVKSAAATWNETGDDGVPTGWTVVTEREANGHALVDLGLRSNGNKILFATMNIGANSPEEYGDYFAWGETSKRYTSISGNSVVGGSFTWSNCPYHTGSTDNTGWSKYIPAGKESYTVSGTADNKLTLEAGDDVASVLWGSNWRMPDKSDLEYLISDNVTYSWTDDYNGTGVSGLIVTGKDFFSSASLFLPAAGWCVNTTLDEAGGFGYYWSRSVYSNRPYNAWFLYFEDDDHGHYVSYGYRDWGLSVRPVLVIPE